jgi:Tol biopolymer transport system component
VRQGTLFAQAFDLKLLQVVGDPIRVASDVAYDASTGQAAFSASDTGILVYRTGAAANARAELAWVSRAGKALGTVGDVAPYRQIRISPDEKHAIIERGAALFTLDLGTRITSRFTIDEGGLAPVGDPVWSPDGRAVAFLQYGGSGNGEFFRQSLGAREVTPLFAMPGTLKFTSDWSPDGQFLLFHTLPPAKLYAGPLSGDRTPLLLAQSQRAIDSARFSPDGKWVAYNTDETGESQTWVASFPVFDNRRQVSARGGGQARWRADGRELFYLAPDGHVMSVAIVPDSKTGVLEFGAPAVLFQSPISAPNMTLDQYDVTRDGQRFLFIQPHIDPNATPTPLAPVTVVVNWTAGIRK